MTPDIWFDERESQDFWIDYKYYYSLRMNDLCAELKINASHFLPIIEANPSSIPRQTPGFQSPHRVRMGEDLKLHHKKKKRRERHTAKEQHRERCTGRDSKEEMQWATALAFIQILLVVGALSLFKIMLTHLLKTGRYVHRSMRIISKC
jgi:hypothetical protein